MTILCAVGSCLTALNTDYQEVTINHFKSLGGDISLGFDRYEEVTVSDGKR